MYGVWGAPPLATVVFAGPGLAPPDVHTLLQPVTHAGLGLLTKTTHTAKATLTLDAACWPFLMHFWYGEDRDEKHRDIW